MIKMSLKNWIATKDSFDGNERTKNVKDKKSYNFFDGSLKLEERCNRRSQTFYKWAFKSTRLYLDLIKNVSILNFLNFPLFCAYFPIGFFYNTETIWTLRIYSFVCIFRPFFHWVETLWASLRCEKNSKPIQWFVERNIYVFN